MFDLVTKYKRVIQVFLFLLALTFMTWGIESYTTMRGSSDAVATVNGIEVSQREFQDEVQRQQDQLRRMFGRNLDPAVLDTPESRQALLDGIIALVHKGGCAMQYGGEDHQQLARTLAGFARHQLTRSTVIIGR